jgi:hypothetical protein
VESAGHICMCYVRHDTGIISQLIDTVRFAHVTVYGDHYHLTLGDSKNHEHARQLQMRRWENSRRYFGGITYILYEMEIP